MDISFHWHNLEKSDALKEYAEKKIQKLAPLFNSLIGATVRFKVEKINQICEFTLTGDGSEFFAAETHEKDLYAAIDLVEKKLVKQINKSKEKQEGKHHREK